MDPNPFGPARRFSRRTIVVSSVATAMSACAKAPVATPVGDDVSLGAPKAPVKVVEYASVGCPVCGAWYRDVFPAFKAKYIDTNVVYFTLREMLVGDANEQAVAAAGFLLARCSGGSKYFSVVDAIFKNQMSIFQDPKAGLLNIAKSNGFDEARFDACINDPAALQALNTRVQRYAQNDQINSTPTFVINGRPLTPGYTSLSDLGAAIASARASK